MPKHAPHHHHHRHRPPHHHGERLIDALERLIEARPDITTEQLAEQCRDADEPEALELAALLNALAAELIPPKLAIARLSSELDISAHKRNLRLLESYGDRWVGLVMPLPPHVTDFFVQIEKSSLLVPDHHHVPPHLRDWPHEVFRGSRECRRVIGKFDLIVFEAYRENGHYRIDPDVADVVDTRVIPAATQFVLHMRPHLHSHDVIFSIGGQSLALL